MRHRKYIYDCLYGAVFFDEDIYKIINVPEIQRLREIRLCNINSLSITGSANINRYEHSIGTCHLASICMAEIENENPFIGESVKKNFIRAALLHDIANAPFGHSFEYIIAKDGFDPEEGFDAAVEGRDSNASFLYKGASMESIFFGMPRKLASILNEDDIKNIGEYIRGDNEIGKLLCGIIDLDNIDNVYRMAYHMGINFNANAPVELAKSLRVIDGNVVIKEAAIPLLWDWYYTREKMYKLLLLNPDEFSGKCMLTECIDVSKNELLNWSDTDYELLQKIGKIAPVSIDIKKKEFEFFYNEIFEEQIIIDFINANTDLDIKRYKVFEINQSVLKIKVNNITFVIELDGTVLKINKIINKKIDVAKIARRLMIGKLYGCVGIFETNKIECYEDFLTLDSRLEIEIAAETYLNNNILAKNTFKIAFHPILDKNKTRRQINMKTIEGESVTVGESSNSLLIGAFIKNSYGSTTEIELGKIPDDILENIENYLFQFLGNHLKDNNLKRIELYEEYKYIL